MNQIKRVGEARQWNLLLRSLAAAHEHVGLFHASLALLSNAHFGVDVCSDSFTPRPIHKHEGGVSVRGREIVPFLNPLRSRIDAAAVREPIGSDDTAAVAQACTELLTEVDWGKPLAILKEHLANVMNERTGIAKDKFDQKVNDFIANPFVDPLCLLFDMLP